MITNVTIRRFKTINEITLSLDRINILVGSNNSGKSSVLQALQFGASVSQTLSSLGTQWKNGSMTRSFPASQLVYTPLRDIASLVRNKWFAENYYGIEIVIEGGVSTVAQQATIVSNPVPKSIITMEKGRGEFIKCAVKGPEMGRLLEPLSTPFAVYVPGLAGIPAYEEYRSEVLVRKAAARGDANSVFRNILWLLKQNSDQWDAFTSDLQQIFPDRHIDVDFQSGRDEHIYATVSTGEYSFPIDAAGTGVLQAVQILAYVNLYKPQLLILDEPDAHLHPNNQRRLAKLLVALAEKDDFQVLLSTHSRHLLDSLRDDAKIHWIRHGTRVPDDQYSNVDILMDVGALDRGDLLKAGKIKCVVLSEDDDVVCISALLKASGFKMEETEIWSHKGCTKKDAALALCRFIEEHSPAIKIVIHRDRDYMTQEEVTDYETDLKKGFSKIYVFVTHNTDAESYYLESRHYNALEPSLDIASMDSIIDLATKESAEYSLKKFINSRTQADALKLRKENKQVNHGELALECANLYNSDPIRYRHGKRVLGCVRNMLQKEKKVNPNPYRESKYICEQELVECAESIWPPITVLSLAPKTI